MTHQFIESDGGDGDLHVYPGDKLVMDHDWQFATIYIHQGAKLDFGDNPHGHKVFVQMLDLSDSEWPEKSIQTLRNIQAHDGSLHLRLEKDGTGSFWT